MPAVVDYDSVDFDLYGHSAERMEHKSVYLWQCKFCRLDRRRNYISVGLCGLGLELVFKRQSLQQSVQFDIKVQAQATVPGILHV